MSTPIPANWEVPRVFRDRLGSQAGRQRTMSADGHVLIILHEVPDPNSPGTRTGQFFWRNPEGRWRSTGPGKGSSALAEHVDAYSAALEGLQQKVENAHSAADYFGVVHAVSPIRHATRNLHSALQEAREAAHDDKFVITQRDRSGDLERSAELIYNSANDGLEFTTAKQSEEQARASARVERSAHRLNLLASLTLPVTAVGSLLGMNLAHGYEQWKAPWPFWAVTAVTFVLGFAVRGALAK